MGIELTTLHRHPASGEEPVQASEAMGNRVIERAAKLYADKGGAPVRCTVHMNRAHIRTDDVEAAADAIANRVLRKSPPVNATSEIDDLSAEPLLDQHVAPLSVHRFDFMAEPLFSVAGVAWLAPLTRNQIEGVLRAKSRSTLRTERNATPRGS